MTQDLPERSRVVQEHLGRAGISTAVQELPESTRTAAEAASAVHCEVGAIASSLLFIADDEPLLVMTSGRHRADLDLLAAAVGVQQVRMATAKQVREFTGQAIGGVAPTGHPQPIRTLIDETLAEHSRIWAAAGTPHTVMPLTFDQLVTLTDGVTTRVAVD